jgi:ring-1,2-phenylacetyl-CoA epoxidase subunit PaaA
MPVCRRLFPLLPTFFGQSRRRNNALYRNFGIKQRNDEAIPADDIMRARAEVEHELELELPAAITA